MTSLRTFTFPLLLALCVSRMFAQTNLAIPDAHLTFTTIDVPGAVFTGVWGINSGGDTVGNYGQDTSSDSHGFLYRNGIFSFFDYPGANVTVPLGINDFGMIVGHTGQNPVLGFLYDGVTFTTLQAGNNSATFASGLNNLGAVVGGAGTIFTTKGFRMLQGHYRVIKFPGTYVYGYASSINDMGLVVGFTDDVSYLYDHGRFRNIRLPGAAQTTASGINAGGIIVGSYLSSTCNCAFAYRNGKFLSFSFPGAALTGAGGINSSGQIVGQYTFDFQTYHGFVTSPISESDFN